MTEVDVTEFFQGETWGFSGSVVTHGLNAAKQTWANAMTQGLKEPLLKTEDELDAMRHWAKDTGAWERAEIAAWTDQELNALFIQLVAGDMRAGGLDGIELEDAEGWTLYERGAESGRYSGSIYKGDDGRVYYQLD